MFVGANKICLEALSLRDVIRIHQIATLHEQSYVAHTNVEATCLNIYDKLLLTVTRPFASTIWRNLLFPCHYITGNKYLPSDVTTSTLVTFPMTTSDVSRCRQCRSNNLGCYCPVKLSKSNAFRLFFIGFVSFAPSIYGHLYFWCMQCIQSVTTDDLLWASTELNCCFVGHRGLCNKTEYGSCGV